jgi:hypothetical protein
MSIVRCGHCNAPMTADEASGSHCPVCRHAIADVWLADATAPHACPRSNVFGAAAALLVALFGLVFGLYQSVTVSVGNGKQAAAPAPVAAAHPVSQVPKAAEAGPGPRSSKRAGGTEPLAKIKQGTPPNLVANAGPVPTPAPETAQPPRNTDSVIVKGEDRLLNLPNGDYAVEDLRGGRVRLRGKVKALTVAAVDGATLDASELDAEEVVFIRSISRGATVRLRSPHASVEFRGTIDANSNVDVETPNGKVTFVPAAVGDKAPAIEGEARVRIVARDVDIRGIVSGVTTQVLVCLTNGGSLRFEGLDGRVRMQYRKADGAVSEPRIEPGWVRAGAQFKRLD